MSEPQGTTPPPADMKLSDLASEIGITLDQAVSLLETVRYQGLYRPTTPNVPTKTSGVFKWFLAVVWLVVVSGLLFTAIMESVFISAQTQMSDSFHTSEESLHK